MRKIKGCAGAFYPAHVTEQEASVSEAFTVRDDRETSVYRSRSVGSEKARIVFQGVEGAYSEAALKQYFGDAVNSYHVRTWKDAMDAIEDGAADFAVLPIENSSAGAVSEVYDLLVEYENYIVGETVLPVNHVLAGLPGSGEEEITRVYSHPQGLMQCEKYLYDHPAMEKVSVPNTAVAACKVVEEQDKSHAAICSAYAASLNGLEVLREQINDSRHNSTRFIIVTNQKIFLKNADKISICFELPHKSGSLYQMLSHFIFNNLNLTKIESRPIEDRPWEYRFLWTLKEILPTEELKAPSGDCARRRPA